MARFDVRPAQVQRPEQRMLLQPRMLQKIEVLALPVTELAQYLAEKALENEALVVAEPRETAREPEDGAWRPRSVARESAERHDEWLANVAEKERSVAERALEQVALLELEPELDAWVRFLVGCLDENGWLSATDAEILALAHAHGLEPSHEMLARGIACVQRLEPRGLGGRNALESLLLQLDPAGEDYPLLCRVIEEFLPDLSQNKHPSVARALSVDARRLGDLLETIASLDPRPGRELSSTASEPIRPDVVVERTDAGFDVRVERSGLPAVSVDESLAQRARDPHEPKDVRTWLRGKVEEARWLVEAVEGRRATLLRTAIAACQHQRAFLEHGPGHLVPLSLSRVAEELGLSLSTISRTVAEKHVQTPFGIVPLRSFFQGESGGDAGGPGTAVDEVRATIRALFASEDPRAPLSDDEAVARLAEKGIRLARRSVAKYRAELGIPSSYRRRKHA